MNCGCLHLLGQAGAQLRPCSLPPWEAQANCGRQGAVTHAAAAHRCDARCGLRSTKVMELAHQLANAEAIREAAAAAQVRAHCPSS